VSGGEVDKGRTPQRYACLYADLAPLACRDASKKAGAETRENIARSGDGKSAFTAV
jgi:hypothetical protein